MLNDVDNEFELLLRCICSSTSSNQNRNLSENRLLDILSDYHSQNWKRYCSLLLVIPNIVNSQLSSYVDSNNDQVCFFIGIGLQRLIWRHWRSFSNEDQVFLTQTLTQAISSRQQLQQFAKAKLQQVIAGICVVSQSLQPALNLVVEATHPACFVGLSLMKNLLELVLFNDPKISPSQQNTIIPLIQTIIGPITNLSCSVCTVSLQLYNEDACNSMTMALEVLKIIVSTTKIPLGAHISADVVNLLFSLAEMGAERDSIFHQAATSSMEILTEIMSKKFIPPSAGNNSGSFDMLMDLVVKSVHLLKQYRLNGHVDDSPIVLSLLEFESVFAESHLERCVNNSLVGIGGEGSSSGSNVMFSQSIALFFEEMVALTAVTMDPDILIKIVSLWNRVIAISSVKDVLICQPAITLPTASHLLQCCLTQTNKELNENIEELISDLRIEPVVDQHMKEVLSNLSSYDNNSVSSFDNLIAKSSGNEVFGAEESSYVGTDLLSDINSFFAELVTSQDVSVWLFQTVSQLVNQNISQLSPQNEKKVNASVDLIFLVRLLPMVTNNKNQLIMQLVMLITQLVENKMHAYGKTLLCLEVQCCQIVGQILQSIGNNNNSANSPEFLNDIYSVMNLLQSAITMVCDMSISPMPFAIIQAVSILLLQAVISYNDLLDIDNQGVIIKESVYNTVQKLLEYPPTCNNLPLEVYVILICTLDYLNPNIIANTLMNQFIELSSGLELILSISQNRNGNNSPVRNSDHKTIIGSFNRVCGALNSLARNHSISKPNRRQCLVSYLTPLQIHLSKLSSILFQLMIQISVMDSNFKSGASTSVLFASKLVTSLSCSLLQSLGKKTFGKVSSEVFTVSVEFAENSASLIGGSLKERDSVLYEGEGLLLLKQILELSQVLAISTPSSSPTAASQVSMTHRLLLFVANGLSHQHLCAELLQHTLKSGIIAISCYWQKNMIKLPIAEINSNNISNNNVSGVNIQPMAELLTQLCVGSLGPNVPPQDTLTALEGLISLSEQHQLFSAPWFQSKCWTLLLSPCLRAILLRLHSIHSDTIETVLVLLVKAGMLAFVNNNNNHNSNNSDIYQYWLKLGEEVSLIAREYNCGEEVSQQLLQSLLNKYFPMSPNSLDPRIFIDDFLIPVSAEIARL